MNDNYLAFYLDFIILYITVFLKGTFVVEVSMTYDSRSRYTSHSRDKPWFACNFKDWASLYLEPGSHLVTLSVCG